MKNKIVTFGEIMLRLTPPEYHTIENAQSFLANYGGGEANVAVSLSRFGHDATFLTRLPDNQLGDSAIRYLRGYNVNTNHINRGGTNIGIYFLETGFGGRPSKVLYNRKHAAITSVTPGKFDLDAIFKDATWFHFSGITLALSDNVRETLYAMLEHAKKHKVFVSFDCNYRQTLWTTDEAAPIYRKIAPYIDMCFASPFDLEVLFGIPRDKNLSENDQKDKLFRDMISKYKITEIFGTMRQVFSSTDNALAAYCYTKDRYFETTPIRFSIYDRIGAGDSFAAGVIHGLLKNKEDIKYALEFGVSTSILKHTVWGDAFNLGEQDVLNYMQNKDMRVVR